MTAPPPLGHEVPPPAVDGTASLLIMMARLEGKVDAALARQGAQVDEHARRIEAVEHALDARDMAGDARAVAVDARLRAVEQRPAISPRAALGGAAAFAAIFAAIAPFLDRLYS